MVTELLHSLCLSEDTQESFFQLVPARLHLLTAKLLHRGFRVVLLSVRWNNGLFTSIAPLPFAPTRHGRLSDPSISFLFFLKKKNQLVLFPSPSRSLVLPWRDLLWLRPTLASSFSYFGHDLTNFGHGQFLAFSRRERGEGGGGPKGGAKGEAQSGKSGEGLGCRRGGGEGRRAGAREWALKVGAGGWGEGVGTQKQKKGGGPKFRAFFSFSRSHFHYFFSLWGSSRVFFPLSGGLLVEFWRCFGRSGSRMCWFSPLRCRGNSLQRPAGRRELSHDNPRAKTSTFEGPDRPKHHQNSTKRPPERGKKTREDPRREKKRMKMGAGEGKKARNFGRSGGGRSGGRRVRGVGLPWPK